MWRRQCLEFYYICLWVRQICEIGEHLKDCKRIKILVVDDDDVVTCDEREHTPESVVINPGNGTNHWLVAIVLLAITCLLLLVAIVVKCYMKRELNIPCFKVWFSSVDHLPPKLTLGLPNMIIVVRSVFHDGSKYYPQILKITNYKIAWWGGNVSLW